VDIKKKKKTHTMNDLHVVCSAVETALIQTAGARSVHAGHQDLENGCKMLRLRLGSGKLYWVHT